MSDFCARWVTHSTDGKVESLRQPRLALIRRSTAESTKREKNGSFQNYQEATSTATPHEAGYAYPFYWAPFVLIGNFQ
jgi:CHAT domain-containing protein